MRTLRLCLVSLVVLLPSFFYGQGVATGDLHVTVKDPQGSLVTSATVTVRDEAKGIERSAASNGSGGYSAQALPPAERAGRLVFGFLRDRLIGELKVRAHLPHASHIRSYWGPVMPFIKALCSRRVCKVVVFR